MNFERLFARIAPEQRDKARHQDTLVATDGLVDPDLLATQLCEQGLSDEATLRGDQMEDMIELTVARDAGRPYPDATVPRAKTAATIEQPAALPNPGDFRSVGGFGLAATSSDLASSR